MNDPRPFPAQPSPSGPSLAPQVNDKTSLLAGTPLAVVGVMFWEKAAGHPLDAVTAVAFGTVFATIVGYAGHVVKTLIDRHINSV